MLKKLVYKNRAIVFTFAFLLFTFYFANAQTLQLVKPEAVGMSSAKLNQIEALVNKDIADKKLPGAVILIGRKGKIVYRKAFGNRSLVPTVEKMTTDTIFDLASLTKVVATSTSVMVLLERGQIRLNDNIGKFIPEIEDKDVKSITIQQLLTHVSGFAPDFDLREKWLGRGGMLNALYKEKLRTQPGIKFVYSDINFIVLAEIVQRVSNRDIAAFADENVFAPLKMDTTGYGRVEPASVVQSSGNSANAVSLSRIAPTENIKGQQNYLGSKFEGTDAQGSRILRGQVHDPTAFRMNGMAGHAGLFSTADDLARYCQMILNGGILEGTRILSPVTIALMTKPNVVSEIGDARGLGLDINSSFSSNRGEFFPLGSFGHTGFTGTSIWIDPISETFVVFLSNRVHPDGKGDVTPLRARVASLVASSVSDLTPTKIREAEVNYYASVMPQIEKFKALVASQKSQVAGQKTANAIVSNGIDVLEKNNFKELNGLRIGLVTNHTGRNRAGKQTIDILKEAANVQLISLFSPEHGIRGQLDQEKITDSVDEKTGLPIYSLYGETRRPKPEQLQNLDAIVFDIQDIGTRFYTYISTLRNVMEEAAKAKIKVIVLDRPNPINGIDIEGGLADEDKLSFIAAHTISVRHGMTVGEIAQMMNAERKIGADLSVIKMDNWGRSMWFDETNQNWVNPSPNMRSLTEATLYPGIGLLETTNVSVGRGTDTPFEVLGAPWLDGQKLALFLNQKNLGGVRFVPIKFKPNASVFKDQDCGGINIIITDREKLKSVRVGLEIATALRTLFPNDWKVDSYNRLWVNGEVFEMVRRGSSAEEIEKAYTEKLNTFKNRRALYLLYK